MIRALATLALLAAPALAGDAQPRAYTVVDGARIPAPLTGGTPADGLATPPGDAARGARVAERLCAQCHALPGAPPPPRDAEAVGPALSGVGGRLDVGALRLAVVNLAIAAPAALGHAFYDLPPYDPDAAARPETVLTAAEVEDVVAWLAAQTR